MIPREQLKSISYSLIADVKATLDDREVEVMLGTEGCKNLLWYLGQNEREILISEEDGVSMAEHYLLGAEMAHYYLRQLHRKSEFDVRAYEEKLQELETMGVSAIDELWVEIGLWEPHLRREMEWVAKRGNFFDDYFVEGVLAVLGSYLIKPDCGYEGAVRLDLVEN